MFDWARVDALAYHRVSVTIKGAVILSGGPRLNVEICVLQPIEYWSWWVWCRHKRAMEGRLKGQLFDQSIQEGKLSNR